MVIGCACVTFRAEWVTSLKEKRMVIKNLMERAKHKFNISIAEVDCQDCHETLVIGFACVSNSASHADEMVEKVVRFLENNTDALLQHVEKEIL